MSRCEVWEAREEGNIVARDVVAAEARRDVTQIDAEQPAEDGHQSDVDHIIR